MMPHAMPIEPREHAHGCIADPGSTYAYIGVELDCTCAGTTGAYARAPRYAAKWRADGHTGDPTDDALAVAFAGCVRPAWREEYPAIRRAILEGGVPA